MAHQELLISWLKDAHSMETGLIPILENHANDAKNYPQIQARIQQHVEETRQHANLVQGCIERHGESISAVKTGIGSLIGTVQSVATGPFEDQLVKNALADFASENFEVACYRALIVAAQQLGDQETVRVCEQILRDDQEMASWLEQNLPLTVQHMIQERAAEHTS